MQKHLLVIILVCKVLSGYAQERINMEYNEQEIHGSHEQRICIDSRVELTSLHQILCIFLYERLYNLFKYFHFWLWADLEDSIPSRPVAVIKINIPKI